MTQTYQMKHNAQGTIYSLLMVESDGQMTMTFHGTDREISHEVTENADGWLCYPGAMFPGLASGRWNKMDDVRCKMEDVRCVTEDGRCVTEPLTMNSEPSTTPVPVGSASLANRVWSISHQSSTISHQPSALSPLPR